MEKIKTMAPWLTLLLITVFAFSCAKSKEKQVPENAVNEWKFTKIINTHSTKNSGYGLDFYQYKGNQVRILQFEFDDYVTLYFLDSIVLKTNDLRFPISSIDGYLTVNNQFFDKKTNRIYKSDKVKWVQGDAPYFNVWVNFDVTFNNMPTTYKNAGNYDACIYSFEKPNAVLAAQETYTFLDFKNNKAVFYAPGSPNAVVRTGSISELFPNGANIDWTKIDAAVCDSELGKTSDATLYLFDFDAQKMYTSFRSGKATATPKMSIIEAGLDFSKQFHISFSSHSNAAFDFKK